MPVVKAFCRCNLFFPQCKYTTLSVTFSITFFLHVYAAAAARKAREKKVHFKSGEKELGKTIDDERKGEKNILALFLILFEFFSSQTVGTYEYGTYLPINFRFVFSSLFATLTVQKHFRFCLFNYFARRKSYPFLRDLLHFTAAQKMNQNFYSVIFKNSLTPKF